MAAGHPNRDPSVGIGVYGVACHGGWHATLQAQPVALPSVALRLRVRVPRFGTTSGAGFWPLRWRGAGVATAAHCDPKWATMGPGRKARRASGRKSNSVNQTMDCIAPATHTAPPTRVTPPASSWTDLIPILVNAVRLGRGRKRLAWRPLPPDGRQARRLRPRTGQPQPDRRSGDKLGARPSTFHAKSGRGFPHRGGFFSAASAGGGSAPPRISRWSQARA
jgi:hypothetical protein